MTTKQILFGIAALIVLGIAVFVYTKNDATPMPNDSEGSNGVEEIATQTYTSPELGFTFDYPEDYTLESHEDGNAERSWTTLTLIETALLKEYEASGAMEGPPSIAVQVFDNVEELDLEEWITATSYSNYKLASDPELLQGEVGGVPARAYQHSGLYETNAVVVAYNEKIYMFSVSWLTQADENIKDFGDLLESVRFN